MLLNEQGWQFLLELCTVKQIEIRRDAIWTVAILAANTGLFIFLFFPSLLLLLLLPYPSLESHEFVANVFGWKTILFFARTEDPEIQVLLYTFLLLHTNRTTGSRQYFNC